MNRFRTVFLFVVGLLAMGSWACDPGSSQGLPVAQHRTSINNGTPEYGHDGVVLIMHQQGSACTGTIIGSRVILTAKHCVVRMDQSGNAAGMLSTSGFGIFIGQHPQVSPWSWNPDYTIAETRTTDGPTINDNDIAVMITAQPMSETPYPVVSQYESGFIGSQVHLIGYGLDRCSGGQSGAKLRTTDQVVGWQGFHSFYTQGKGANSGDSGGPVFDENYRVVGVMVAVPQDPYSGQLQCGTTICTRVDHFQDMIRQALEDTGGCYPTGPEVCGDGEDNDCNGLVDDGCNPNGAACQSNADCASRFCAALDGGQVCAQPCDPWNPTGACGGGDYCKMLSCDQGACVPGSAGPKGAGELCGQDTDCQSLLCRPGADGRSYCALRCTLNAGECLPNEVCVPLGTSCGACLLSTVSQGPRGTGEMCQIGQNCRSGLCINDAGASYCSVPCEDDAGCPEAFHCREGRCVRGPLGEPGDPCVSSEDCADGLVCHTEDGVSYCTEAGCGTCPPAMSCTPTGTTSVCTADAAPVGARCTSGQDCLSGSCLVFGSDTLCTEPCNYGDPCPAGTYCTLADTGVLACAPNSLPPQTSTPPPGDGGGKGGCQAAGGAPSGWLPLWLAALGLWIRRRRRAP